MNDRTKKHLRRSAIVTVFLVMFMAGLIYGSTIVENRKSLQTNETVNGVTIGENETHRLVAWCKGSVSGSKVNASNWKSERVQESCYFTLDKKLSEEEWKTLQRRTGDTA